MVNFNPEKLNNDNPDNKEGGEENEKNQAESISDLEANQRHEQALGKIWTQLSESAQRVISNEKESEQNDK